MARTIPRLVCLILMAGLTGACGQKAATAQTDSGKEAAVAAAPEIASAAAVESLPLKRGFYVSSDTPCGRASNATLSLLSREGFTVAGRDFCAFLKIEKTGATTYRVTEECSSGGEAWGSEEHKETQIVAWEIPNDASHSRKNENTGWESSARYCAQSSLPEPWRDNDIRDLIH